MKNTFIEDGSTIKILIPYKEENLELLIDKDDLHKISSIKGRWYAIKSSSGNVMYAFTRNQDKNFVKQLLIHRLIMGATKGTIIDHINGNGLDNRKENLRFVTKKENGQNRDEPMSNNKSGVLGVHWHKDVKKWNAGIRVDGKRIDLGYYDDIERAKEIVSIARAKYMTHSKEVETIDKHKFKEIEGRKIAPCGKNKSGYRYVNWSKFHNKWMVQIWVGKKRHHFGYYDILEDAAEKAEEMRLKYKSEKIPSQ